MVLKSDTFAKSVETRDFRNQQECGKKNGKTCFRQNLIENLVVRGDIFSEQILLFLTSQTNFWDKKIVTVSGNQG